MKTGFLEGPDGNKSNSRLIADGMILSAIVIAIVFTYIGLKFPEVDLMKIALAISVEVGAIGGSAMLFLFGQKTNETKTTDIINPLKSTIMEVKQPEPVICTACPTHCKLGDLTYTGCTEPGKIVAP